MRPAFSIWLKAVAAAAGCLAAQVPPQVPAASQRPLLATIDAYVRRVDGDQTLSLRRHLHTYGHAAKPGADSLFWIFHTDQPFSSANVYFAGSRIVKIVETARGPRNFSEYSYYLQNGELLFVRNRQVQCPSLKQRDAWFSNTSPCTKAADYFFRGTYYFAHDSCISRQEHGKQEWTPEYSLPGGNGRWVAVPKLFPYQAARYLVCFPHPPAPKRR